MKLSVAILVCCAVTLSCSPSNAETIKCKYHMDDWWETNGELHQCTVQNPEIFAGGRVTIDRAEGEHEAGKSDDDVQAFLLDGASNLEKFPANLGRVFKNLALVYIHNSNLTEITSEDLKQFPNLKHFKIQLTEVQYISADLFLHNPLLEAVDLIYNPIAHIDRQAFSGLGKLRAARIYDNACGLYGEATTRLDVLDIVKRVEAGECQSPKFTTTTEQSKP